MHYDFSIIVPAYNEARYLPRLLESIDVAKANFLGSVEVIIADNMSTDDTAKVALSYGCKVVIVTKRCIGAVRNGGASVAAGRNICFIDADSAIHPETFSGIEAVLQNKIVGGVTGVYLERMSPGIFVIYCVMQPISWITGLDTGVVFCRKNDFQAIGGYNEDLLFAEDVRFLLDLKRLGKLRGQRLGRAKSVKALASTRKFDEHGDWHYFTLLAGGVWSLCSAYMWPDTRPLASSAIKDYWYVPDR
jgi:glycosyltransferase involved in cell wall biosynthesis